MPRKKFPKPTGSEKAQIDGGRVRDAIQARGLSDREVGRRVSDLMGTVSADSATVRIGNLVKGQPTCTRSFRESLAKVLDFPEDWLSGENPFLPGARYWYPLEDLEDDSQYESVRRSPPNRRQIAEYEFERGIANALVRINAKNRLQASLLRGSLERLVDPSFWRQELLPMDRQFNPDAYRDGAHLVESEEDSDARERLVAAFLHILEPWRSRGWSIDESALQRITGLWVKGSERYPLESPQRERGAERVKKSVGGRRGQQQRRRSKS